MPALHYTPRLQQQQHVTDWQASGLTRTQYAQLHQLSPKALTRWVAKWSPVSTANPVVTPPPTGPEQPFIPATIIPEPCTSTTSVTLKLKRCSITCLPSQLHTIMGALNLC